MQAVPQDEFVAATSTALGVQFLVLHIRAARSLSSLQRHALSDTFKKVRASNPWCSRRASTALWGSPSPERGVLV